MSPNNNSVVRKTGANKTLVLYRMRMHQFTPRHAVPDLRILTQELKPDLEVSLEHDDLYATMGV